jgi:FkbM family methyltransferase
MMCNGLTQGQSCHFTFETVIITCKRNLTNSKYLLLMSPFLVNKRIDLVDFDGLKLFMLEDDNLYRSAVTENRKRQNLETYQKKISAENPPAPPITPGNMQRQISARHSVWVTMHYLWENGLNFDVLDIGSHIGDFGIKAGNFIRCCGQNSRVVTFDPSEPGALVPYSIELNGLEKIVKHEMLAVSDTSGLVLFQYRPGHSEEGAIVTENKDAAGLAAFWLKRFNQLPLRKRFAAYFGLGVSAMKRLLKSGKINTRYSLIARAVDVLEYLDQNQFESNLFVKVDIEGNDPRVIDRLLSLLTQRKLFFIFEFTPARFADQREAAAYLKKLSRDFLIFDLYYCPNPTRCTAILPDQIDAFTAEVAARPHGYTDVFLLDQRTPKCDQLVQRLSALSTEPDAIML